MAALLVGPVAALTFTLLVGLDWGWAHPACRQASHPLRDCLWAMGQRQSCLLEHIIAELVTHACRGAMLLSNMPRLSHTRACPELPGEC